MALATAAVTGRPVSGTAVAVQLRLPEVMAAAYGSPFEMRPGPPVAAGDGWVHADLGAAGDAESFALLRSTLPAGVGARRMAEEAQGWRLPVCDYRRRPSPGPVRRVPGHSPAGGEGGLSPGPVPWRWTLGTRPPVAVPHGRPLRVLDLTNMWAGPLATWLLAGLGASVTKIEPSFRPDGFRAVAGGGIYPGGQPCQPGRDSGMWNALNRAKKVVDLDLRRRADRDRFVEMAGASDVVIDSFSPRVMPNFGLELPLGPLYVSMPAFPPGPQRDWVAYGSGVHATSGLGDIGDGRFAAPAVSYPDPLAGFAAALAVTAALRGRSRGVPIDGVEVSLAEAVLPLAVAPPDAAGPAGPGRTSGTDDRGAGEEYGPLVQPGVEGLGGRLLERAGEMDLMREHRVCGRLLPHPAAVFATNENVF
ncbi:MAG: CoA transferase [Acidobacteriota bacterium]|nr:CoA transferase [Acidobacteriota bacterium]